MEKETRPTLIANEHWELVANDPDHARKLINIACIDMALLIITATECGHSTCALDHIEAVVMVIGKQMLRDFKRMEELKQEHNKEVAEEMAEATLARMRREDA